MRENLPKENELASIAVDCCYRVHKALGPGLIESVYEKCLTYELSKHNLQVEAQVALPVHYEGIKIEAGLRIDLWVERTLILELKSVESLAPIHKAQLMTYMKLTGNHLGLLVNFNTPLIKDGIKRVVLT